MKEQVRPVKIVPKVIIKVKESLTEVHSREVNLISNLCKKTCLNKYFIKKYMFVQVVGLQDRITALYFKQHSKRWHMEIELNQKGVSKQ